jgi:CheY-like chemotaxis protein
MGKNDPVGVRLGVTRMMMSRLERLRARGPHRSPRTDAPVCSSSCGSKGPGRAHRATSLLVSTETLDATPPILIVDDNQGFCDAVRLTLEEEGYTVHTARNGPSALAKLGAIPRPSLVLLDILMPGMSGTEVVAAMRANEALTGIPVVFVSIVEREEHEGVRVLPKPIDLESLLAVVREHDGRARAEREGG